MVIVGGSIAGLITAALLQQAGFYNVEVHELAGDASSKSGGGIARDWLAVDALTKLGLYVPEVAWPMLTEMDATQQQLFDLFGLQALAPKS